jgi:Fe-S-cluster containining protein
VTLTVVEQSKFGSICIEHNCVYLGANGCTLGAEKPFSCSLYPLSFDPQSRTFSYDSECPVMPTYVSQLSYSSSEASQHLKMVTEKILRLEGSDLAFLKENREVDVDYFDLIKLSHPALPGRSAK